MPLRRWITAWLIAMAISAGVAGCGGGGGDEPPRVFVESAPRVETASAGSDIRLDNFTTFAQPLARAVLIGTGTGAAWTGGPVGAGTGTAAKAGLRTALRARSLAVSTETQACPLGGSLSTTVDDANGNQLLDGGDAVQTVFAQCRLDDASPVLTGGFFMAIRDSVLDARGVPTALDIQGRMTLLSLGTLAVVDGPYRLRMTGCDAAGMCQRWRLSLDEVAALLGSEPATLRLDTLVAQGATGAWQHEVSGALVLGGQAYAVLPSQPFLSADALPVDGSVFLEDAQGDAVLLQALPAERLDFYFYPRGSRSPVAQWIGRTWAEFIQ